MAYASQLITLLPGGTYTSTQDSGIVAVPRGMRSMRFFAVVSLTAPASNGAAVEFQFLCYEATAGTEVAVTPIDLYLFGNTAVSQVLDGLYSSVELVVLLQTDFLGNLVTSFTGHATLVLYG